MGVETPPFVLQDASHGAQVIRLGAAAWLGAPLPGLLTSPLYGPVSGSTYTQGSQTASGLVGGVVGSSDFNIAQNGTPNMSVNVAGGQIYIPGGSASNQGLYYGLCDATVNLTIAAASASNPRIDTIVAYVEDAAYAGSNNDWVLAVVTGTPTSGATLANLAGRASLAGYPSCVVLGFVLVPTSASSIVTADILNAQPLCSPGFSGFLQRGTPYGFMWPTVQTVFTSGTGAIVASMSSLVKGGMTFASNALTVPVTGIYRVSCQIVYENGFGVVTAAGNYQAQIRVGGTQTVTDQVYVNTASVTNPTPGLSVDLPLVAGNAVSLWGYQTSGGSQAAAPISTIFGNYGTYLSLSLVSG